MIGHVRTVLWLGVIMMFLPFLGIPNTWKAVCAVGAGVVLVYTAFNLRKHYRAMRSVIKNLEHSALQNTLYE